MFDESWLPILEQSCRILESIEGEYFPPEDQVFRAFHIPLVDVKVVILGQDCYHKEGQAMGYCFSVPEGVKVPPSLRNIYKELANDVNFTIPNHGDLSKWVSQGVLLLNSSLTVAPGKPGSHLKIWRNLTDEVIRFISSRQENVTFMLWGAFAKKKQKLIDERKHLVLVANHPSPLSANRGGWFGCRHFSKCNEYLQASDNTEIDWDLN